MQFKVNTYIFIYGNYKRHSILPPQHQGNEKNKCTAFNYNMNHCVSIQRPLSSNEPINCPYNKSSISHGRRLK